MIKSFIKKDNHARIGNKKVWRIPHTAGHLNITIKLPDTNPPAVRWILPNGCVIDGNVLGVDVPAGETLCLCDDFGRCGIDMSGQDRDVFLTLRVNEMPVTRVWQTGLQKREGVFSDKRFTDPSFADGIKTGAIVLHIGGSSDSPSKMVFTVDDVTAYKESKGVPTHKSLIIAYAPFFTGDLGRLNTKTQYFCNHIVPDFDKHTQGKELFVPKTIIHHTGVHGAPDLSDNYVGCYAFYGNPNMTPEDYDKVCITLAANPENFQSDFVFDESLYFLAISSRRTSASDEALATLESVGMTIYEMDDDTA